MHLSIYFYSVFFVFVTYSPLRILSYAKTIDTPKTSSKTDKTKITSRSTDGANQIFTISTDVEGKTSQTCQCVVYYLCDTQDVYYPKESESHIKCESQQACCIHPQLSDSPQNSSPNSKDNNTDICVVASQCDQTGLADTYGLGILIERSVFSECPIGKVKCPADKVLPNVVNASQPVISAPPTNEDCNCTPPVYCNADFGENVLREKMFQCDSAEVCCPSDLIKPILVDTPTQAPPTNTECGIKKEVIYSKLSGSSDTIFGEFPWMILLLEKENNVEKVKCGGSLVSSNLVLTAAHCVQNKSMSSFIVRAGEYNLNVASASEELPHQDREIKNITIHHAFYRKLLLHDLALIEVSESFQYSSNVAPICLPLLKSPYSPEDTSIYDLNKCLATGWGSKDSADPTATNLLSKIDLKIIPSDQCVNMLRKSALGSKFFLHESLICAMGKPGTDTCKGDGGGPLICPLRSNPNKYVQVGVIAGGLACTSPFPSLYASLLLNNSAWITEEIYFQSIFSV